MKRGNRLFLLTAAFLFVLCVSAATALPAHAAEKEGYEFPSAGVAQILDPGAISTDTPVKEEKALNINEKFENEKERMEKELAMANVQNALNIRAEADEKSEKVGYLYKDCGGTILERKDGWTKLKSGNVIGWAKDEYLLFGEEAKAMAEDVGNWIVTLDAEAVRVRMEPNMQADIYGLLAYDDSVEFIDVVNSNWISVDYNDEIGYINTDYVNVKFHIDEGETMEVIRVREREEAERKRKANRGAVAADADELRLLGALIYCEAGNQPYEGMVAVGAVVMNRVKSGAYPNTIHSVIYASGQFTPAMTGKVAKAYEGNVPELCLQAAQAAINGETTVGDATHFRRAGKREGYVLGDHVFW
ncbi:MAG: cell wall hydrolase [Lachnospiraceae bacterium]|nr:cell wall hydrolase [Lachnospiraceae bacterium]MCI7042438.1 cell wall hydrolase [Lachnospiraceae bacterium]MDD7627792.1 cell wall hydrolase [Lachnospiraceae bacterium]MDY4117803.1 cell wall hydrolase [Lachnospiraceae bacterium]